MVQMENLVTYRSAGANTIDLVSILSSTTGVSTSVRVHAKILDYSPNRQFRKISNNSTQSIYMLNILVATIRFNITTRHINVTNKAT